MREALEMAEGTPRLIVYDDAEYDGPKSAYDETEYEAFIADGDADFLWKMPANEWDAMSVE